MVQRTEVEGLQQIQSGRSQRAATQINRQLPVEEQQSSFGRASQILNGLSGFVDASSQAAFKQAQVEVENKKIIGMSTAVSGGKLGEQASNAEHMGFDLVQSQTDLLKVNDEIARFIQDNPEAPDDQLNQLKQDKYGALLSQYQDKDKEVFQALSVKAQESQMTMYGIQQQAKQKYREQKAEETLNYNIGSTIDTANTMQQGQELIHQYISQGKAMGMDEFKVKSMLMEQMKLTAAQGDPRLMKFIQATDWGKYGKESRQATELFASYQKQAQAAYEAAQQKANLFTYGQGLADLERLAKGGASDIEIQMKMKELQGQGLKFTPSSVASYLTMGKTVNASQQALADNVQVWQANKGQFSLAQNPYIDPENKKKVLGAAEDAIIQQSSQVPEGERGDFVISNMFRLSKQENMPVNTISTALTSIANIDPQQPISGSVQTWTKYLLAADDQTIRMNVPAEKDQKMLFGMRDVLINSQGTDAEVAMRTAISRGQTMRDNNVPLTAQQNKVLRNKSSSEVKAFEDPTMTSWHFFTKRLPDQAKDYVTNQINARAQALYQVTGDTEKATALAAKEYKQNNMILTGGITANIGVGQLAAKVPEFATAGADAEMVQKKAVASLDYQVGNILTAQSAADGLEYKREDAKVIFSNSGDTYQVNVGGLVVGTYYTGALKDQYKEDFFKKWEETQTKEQTRSESYRAIKQAEEFASEIPRD